MSRSRSSADPAEVLEFAIEAARTLRDDKCEDVMLLDVRGMSQVCDYVLIASGTSERQMKTAAQSVEDLGKERGTPHFK
ncbi:MAG: RsfS/YbeB/iojap family protein, partial [Planctomycetota bacterium]|nr:RsfS/YbeB/iojap family protein [Planctomycetota bacterium]